MTTLISLIESDPSSVPHDTMSLASGDVLTKQGEVSDDVYVLADGSLSVTVHQSGSDHVIATVDGRGAIVGELVPLGGGRRTATVTAVTPCTLHRLSAQTFNALLDSHPDIAADVAETATRRAEEGELAAIFAGFVETDDRTLVADACRSAIWHRLQAGDVLFSEGDDPDGVYFVVRGRLQVSQAIGDATDEGSVLLAEVGRGGLIGEAAILDEGTRTATVTARRSSVLARFDRDTLERFTDIQPRLMLEFVRQVVTRKAKGRPGTRSTNSVAIAVADSLREAGVVDEIIDALRSQGGVEALSSKRVESLLESPGIGDAPRGSIGDARVSRLFEQAEIHSDHVSIDVDRRPGRWAERAIDHADRLLVVVPAADAPVDAMLGVLGDRRSQERRTIVVVHPPGHVVPTGTGPLIDSFQADDAIHIRRGDRADLQRLARLVTGRGVGIVLGGGGARGFAHLGVYRALLELGVPVDIVGGTSIGSAVGAVLASDVPPEEQVRMAEARFANVLDYTLPVVSVLKGRRIADSARSAFGERDVEDLWLTFFCMSTDLTTTQPRVHRRGSLVQAIRASSAIPGVMPPVPYDGHLLVDGGVLNNLPVDVMGGETPHGTIIAIDVAPTRGPGSRADYGLSVSGWRALRRSLGRGRTPYPGISAVIMRSMIAASQQQRHDRAGMADCYLDLDLRGVSMFEFDKVAAVAQRGYEAAMPRLEAWLGREAGGEPQSIGSSSFGQDPTEHDSIEPGPESG